MKWIQKINKSVPTRTALKNARKEVRHNIYCNLSTFVYLFQAVELFGHWMGIGKLHIQFVCALWQEVVKCLVGS